MEIREISQIMSDRAEEVAAMLLPSGRLRGREWEIGSVRGEPGDSCKVCISGAKRGTFKDFATGEGGDLLDLWQLSRGVTLAEALKEAKQYLGIQEPTFENFHTKKFRKPAAPKDARKVSEAGPVQRYLHGRGLTDASIAAYRLAEVAQIGPWEGWQTQKPWKGPWIVLPSFRGKELVAVKYLHLERKDGKKQTLVEPNCEAVLFGWQAIPDNARMITLCEGEIDAVTLHQYGFPALSVPFGGGKAGKQQWIDNEFPHLERFEEIYLCLDQDETGQQATVELVNRIGAHRCKIVKLPHKDANECLKQGVTAEELHQCFADAETQDPSELKSPTAFQQAVIEEFYPPSGELPGFYLPWKMRKRPVKMLRGEVTIWSGFNGSGKSLILNQMILGAMTQGERACIASFEMHPRKTLSRMTRQALGKERPERHEIENCLAWLDGQLWIFDLLGTARVERIMEVFMYAFRRYGVQQYIIDSLLKCGIASDDYKAQKSFLDVLNDFANETNGHVHLVAHARKGENELTPPTKFDVKGTGDITDLASNVWSVWRNKIKEEDLAKIEAGESTKLTKQEVERIPDALLRCFKARDDRNEEGKIGLFFHKWSLQYHEHCDSRPEPYCIGE